MSPILVLKDGRPVLAIGAAGGRTILSTVYYGLVRLLDRGDAPDAAVAATRFHIETAEPVRVEEGGEALVAGLTARGHQAILRPRFGSLQAIHFGEEPGLMTGVADWRRSGTIASA
jgi:gamma-glutamyltranspeptidase/glutathione hydrolase